MTDPNLAELQDWTLFRQTDGKFRLRLDFDTYLRGGSQVEFRLSKHLLDALRTVEPRDAD